MSKIHILGSCSGTEPYPGCHHTSLVLEHQDTLYWFDAGECCSYTAHLMGLDLLKVRDIFISHPHMDHVGGLGNLLWTMQKMTFVKKVHPEFDLNIFVPKQETLDGTLMVLRQAENAFQTPFHVHGQPVRQGTLLDENGLVVESIPNCHIPYDEAGNPLSWSYRMKFNGKKVVFSGDVKSVDELAVWLDDCDLLLMETGHHKASEVCARLKSQYPGVKDVIFLHHGREILNDRAGALQRAEAAWGGPVKIATDAMTVEL